MRHIRVTRYAALLATLLALTACGARPASVSGAASGSATPSPSTPSVSASSAPRACFDHVVESQTAQPDLDGDGTADDVSYTAGAGGQCRAGLTARIAGSTSGPVSVRTAFQPASLRVVTVPGRAGQLLVARQSHPRGGFQDHLYAFAGGQLAELSVDGHPLLPFVATDTPGSATTGFTARCTAGGIEVLRAVAHQPIGVAPAFDVVATTYTIEGTALTASGTRKVADNVLDRQLERSYPALARRSVLSQGCR